MCGLTTACLAGWLWCVCWCGMLLQLFGSVRDDWMAEDPRGWLGANRFYTGSDLCMGCPRFDAYVITTKQARFVEALLQHKGGWARRSSEAAVSLQRGGGGQSGRQAGHQPG